MTRKQQMAAEIIALRAELAAAQAALRADPNRPYYTCASLAECSQLRHRAQLWTLTSTIADTADQEYP